MRRGEERRGEERMGRKGVSFEIVLYPVTCS